MSVVTIDKMTKRFGETTALQEIDLTIEEREFVSLIGPSGCGKSTLLRIIGDLIQPSSGNVVVNGKPARKARIDRDYGIVFQDPVLYDWRTVAKNIALPLELAGWDRRRRRERIREMIDLSQPRAATTREDPRFFELVTRVREALHLGSDLDRQLKTEVTA